MRLPRVRMPSVSFDWLGRLGGRTTWLYIGYTAVLFVGGLLYTFPYQQLVDRVLSSVNTGSVNVGVKSVNFAWFRGWELAGLRVEPAAADGEAPFIEFSRVWVRPSLGALVRGNPYDVLMNAELYGGTLQGEASLTEGNIVGVLQLRELQIGRYRTLASLLDEGQIDGRVSGQLNLEARTGNLNSGQLTGDLVLDGAALTAAKVQGVAVPDIHLRQTKLKFVVHGGRLEVQELSVAGDVNVQGSGQIMLRDPPQNSVLNLRATFETTLATPDPLKAAVALIPRPAGAKPDAPINISGTLGAPKFR